jgi:hypothetical protein
VESTSGYVYDRAGRRTRAYREDGRYWNYGYNSRGEVTSAKKYGDDGDILPGLQFEYAFDGIGNRTTGKYGGDLNGANLQTITYTANDLNQYASIVTPGAVTVAGESDSTNSNGISVVSDGGSDAADRVEDFFAGEATATTASGPVWDSDVAINQTGETSGSGAVFHPKNTVSIPGGELSYDDDGNLTLDARWSYQWNDEGRLKLIETNSAADTAGVPFRKYEFLYDNMGRRVSRKSYSGSSYSQVLDRTDSFIWRGWTLVAEIRSDWSEELYFTQGLDLASSLTATGNVGSLLRKRGQDKYFDILATSGTACRAGASTASCRHDRSALLSRRFAARRAARLRATSSWARRIVWLTELRGVWGQSLKSSNQGTPNIQGERGLSPISSRGVVTPSDRRPASRSWQPGQSGVDRRSRIPWHPEVVPQRHEGSRASGNRSLRRAALKAHEFSSMPRSNRPRRSAKPRFADPLRLGPVLRRPGIPDPHRETA